MLHRMVIGFGTSTILFSGLVLGQVPGATSDAGPRQDAVLPTTAALPPTASPPGAAPAPKGSPPPSGAGAAAEPATPEGPAKKLSDAADKLTAAADSLSAASQKMADGADAEDKDRLLAEGRLPWNGFLLKFAEKDKKVITSFGIPEGVMTFNASLEAPLDGETRLAPLVGADHRPLAFQLKFAFGYDFMEEHLRTLVMARDIVKSECSQYQKETGGKPCQASAMRPWVAKKMSKGRSDGIGSRPVPKGVDATVGGEFKMGFDQQNVYLSNLAASPQKRTASEMSLSAVARFYPANWLAIPLTAGAGYEKRIDAKQVTRCASLPSSDTAISGSACEDNALFATEDAKTKLVTHFETALVFAIPVHGGDYSLAPGLDLRDRVELIKDGRNINRTSTTVFVTPTKSPIVTRFGVGLEYDVIMNTAAGANPAYKKGDKSVYPFVVAGGSL